MAKALPIPDVAGDTPLGAFAARVIEVRSEEVEALLAAPVPDGAIHLTHDRRVALRRLRTAIEVFGPTLPKRARRVRRDLKRTFSVLGGHRDADVALEALRALETDLVSADLPGWTGLIAAFEAEATAASAALDGEAALNACADAALLGAAARDHGGPPADRALRRVVVRRLRDVSVRLDALDDPRDAVALHDLRIAAKRLRYVLELAEPALGPVVEGGITVARDLQDTLGQIHDCDVMLPRLRDHRRGLRAVDVAAVGAGTRPPNAARYRGVQTVDTHFRARRDRLREQVAANRGETTEGLERFEAALRRAA